MKRVALIAVLGALPLAVSAQQQPSPSLSTCHQLRDEANNRIETLADQVGVLEAKLKDATKQLEDEKAKSKPVADVKGGPSSAIQSSPTMPPAMTPEAPKP